MIDQEQYKHIEAGMAKYPGWYSWISGFEGELIRGARLIYIKPGHKLAVFHSPLFTKYEQFVDWFNKNRKAVEEAPASAAFDEHGNVKIWEGDAK